MDWSSWDAAAALAKAASYAATLGAAGATLFLAYGAPLLREAQRRSILLHVLTLSALAVPVSAARICLLNVSMSGNLADVFDLSSAAMILGAGEGWAIALRAVGLTLCLAAFKPDRLARAAACVGALLAAASFAAVGHVHALKPDWPGILLLILHLGCIAFWLGALWPLLRVARDADALRTAALATRFGAIALYVVGLLIGAGMLLAYQLLDGVSALWNSGYGRMLVVKVVLVAALLCAAAFNRLWLTPRLLAGEAFAVVSLRRSVRFEMIVGGMILLVTAAFTSLTGPQT